MNTLTKKDDTKKKPAHFKHLGREMAMQCLFQQDITGASDEFSYNLFWSEIRECLELKEDRYFRKGRQYAEKLISGVNEKREEIDKVIIAFSQKWDMARMPVVDRNILRIGVFEMKFCPDVPPVVSIDEAVTVAKDFSSEKSGFFVNGILNSIKNSLNRPPRETVSEL
jgi:N utilization substance protein B